MAVSFQFRCSVLLAFKLIVALTILIFSFLQTDIERDQSALPANFRITFKSVSYSGRHLFCPFPDARAMTVNDQELLEALNLPNDSKVSKELQKYGECRAKVERLNEKIDQCSCNPRILMITMVVVALISILASMVHVCCGPRTPNNTCSFYQFLEGAVWVVLAVSATLIHAVSRETMSLSNTVAEHRYFKTVVNWWVAFGLAYLYALLALIEGVIFLKCPEDDDKPQRVDEPADVATAYSSPTTETVDKNHQIVYRSANKSEEKELSHLMAVRLVIEPRSKVVTLACKTYP